MAANSFSQGHSAGAQWLHSRYDPNRVLTLHVTISRCARSLTVLQLEGVKAGG